MTYSYWTFLLYLRVNHTPDIVIVVLCVYHKRLVHTNRSELPLYVMWSMLCPPCTWWISQHHRRVRHLPVYDRKHVVWSLRVSPQHKMSLKISPNLSLGRAVSVTFCWPAPISFVTERYLQILKTHRTSVLVVFVAFCVCTEFKGLVGQVCVAFNTVILLRPEKYKQYTV